MKTYRHGDGDTYDLMLEVAVVPTIVLILLLAL